MKRRPARGAVALPAAMLALALALVAGAGRAEADADANGDAGGCALCHGAATKLEAQSVHGNRQGVCTACHGGDASALEEKAAHSRLKKFVKRPRVGCASCHEREGEALGKGQHASALERKRFQGCVDCHGWHGVKRAGPALFDATCVKCHAESPDLVEVGDKLKAALVAAEGAWAAANERVGEAADARVHVRPWRERLKRLRVDLGEWGARQHALNLDEALPRAASLAGAAKLVETEAADRIRAAEDHKRSLGYLWLALGVNTLLILARLRGLRSAALLPNPGMVQTGRKLGTRS